ncbi:hypothetical protein CPB83DRAFT_864535 [Crepidotus variabilis]|uniref:DUF7330 domain-containing protein n=1 Tax=Crepidotus variabilis TaxID=179855 RepID=A0A9P6JIL9_9AGAR|nr:hypothetical protein CPB83DRAFT_864535 [Crepidotus variabilis]
MQDGSSSSHQTSSTLSRKASALLPSRIKPSNFIKISRIGGAITGAFLVDREMNIPDKALGNNLFLYSGSGVGSIEADVFCVPKSAPAATAQDKTRKIAIKICIVSGRILLNLYRPQTDEESYPIRLYMNGAKNSRSTLSLPRSFKGPVELCSTGNDVILSQDVQANFTLFVEENGIIEGFIGDFDHNQWTTIDQWSGDYLYWTPTTNTKNTSTLVITYNDEKL